VTRASRPGLAVALAAASGGLLTLAAPGVGAWPLGFVALAPLLVALGNAGVRRAFLLGGTAGLTFFATSSAFMLSTLERFTGWPVPAAFAAATVVWVYLACRLALACWAAALARSRGLPFGPAFLLALASAELLFPSALPWHIGLIWGSLTPLAQVADLGGPIALTLVLAASNLAVVRVIDSLARRHRKGSLAALAYAAVPAAAFTYGQYRVRAVEADIARAPTLRIGLVQTGIGPAGLPGRYATMKRALDLTEKLERRRGPFDLIVWGETAVPNAVDERYLGQWYRTHVTDRVAGPLLFGTGLVGARSSGRVLYNSALISNGSGAIVGRYDKQDLFPFGERIPLGDTFPFLERLFPNSEPLSPGTHRRPLELEDGKYHVAAFICYEAAQPELVNRAVTGRPFELLANLASDAWFESGAEARFHLAMVALRAVEHHRFLVRATTTGISALVDPLGRVVRASKRGAPETLFGEVAWIDTTTLYEAWGDTPWWICFGILLAAFLLEEARRLRRRDRQDVARPGPARRARPEQAILLLLLCVTCNRRAPNKPDEGLPRVAGDPLPTHGAPASSCSITGDWRGETRAGHLLRARVAADGAASWRVADVAVFGEAHGDRGELSIVQNFSRPQGAAGCPSVVGRYRMKWFESCSVLLLRVAQDPCRIRRAAINGLELERVPQRSSR